MWSSSQFPAPRRLFGCLPLVLLLSCACAPGAWAIPFTVHNTGVGAPGAADANYAGFTILSSQPAVYVAAPSGSAWIGPDADGFNTDPVANYSFTTTFDLTGLDPATATLSGQFTADNFAEIFLNGFSTGVTTTGPNAPTGREHYRQLTNFLLNAGFQAGINTLEFRVTNDSLNGGGSYNPTALLVANLSGDADVHHTPEPASLALWCLLGLGGAAYLRRRRHRGAA